MEFVKSRTDHPTANDVYNHIREQIQNISLGTVYRNLALLEEMSEIRMITVEHQPARYDGTVVPHYHVVCTSCGMLMDMNDMPLQYDWNKQANKHFDGEIHYHDTLFYGNCAKCLKE